MGKCVVQLFTKSDILTKVQERTGCPRTVQAWPDEIIASNGYLDGETLKLNSHVTHSQAQKLDDCDVVVLQDKQPSTAPNPQQVTLLSMCHFVEVDRLWYPDVDAGFMLQQDGHGIRLILHHDPMWGTPRRGHFPVAKLRPNEPVLISLNHKSDFSMSSRRARTYWYGQFLFVYCGECSRVEFYGEPNEWMTKLVPWSAARHVDLNKRLF
jgi:hypothetical protein